MGQSAFLPFGNYRLFLQSVPSISMSIVEFSNTAFVRAISQNLSNKFCAGGAFWNILVILNHNFKHLQAKGENVEFYL